MDPTRTIVRLVGVYDADGTVVGELSYFLRARLGKAHCALCDITHGALRERTAWRDRIAALPVPFDLVHRNEQAALVREAGGGTLPFVAAELSDGGVVVLVGPEDLRGCDGAPERLVDAVDAAVARAEPPLVWAE